MQILTTADDFGFSEDSVRATIQCMEQGLVMNASLMAGMPATQLACEYAVAHPQYCYGPHLTFVGTESGETPVSAARDVPSMVDGDGLLLPALTILKRAYRGEIPAQEIEREASAQITLFRSMGIALSYADSHGHYHKLAPFWRVLQPLLARFGITRVRRGQDTWIQKPWRSPTYWTRGIFHPRIARSATTTQHVFLPTTPYDRAHPEMLLTRLRGRNLEIGCHPGHAEEWRSTERKFIETIVPLLRERGHQVCSWKDLAG